MRWASGFLLVLSVTLLVAGCGKSEEEKVRLYLSQLDELETQRDDLATLLQPELEKMRSGMATGALDAKAMNELFEVYTKEMDELAAGVEKLEPPEAAEKMHEAVQLSFKNYQELFKTYKEMVQPAAEVATIMADVSKNPSLAKVAQKSLREKYEPLQALMVKILALEEEARSAVEVINREQARLTKQFGLTENGQEQASPSPSVES